MINLNVKKYVVKNGFILYSTLFLKGEELYIQQFNPESTIGQQVFLSDKKFLGTIKPETFWHIEQNLQDLNI